jgi:MFS superfamily sulfate permease-like transporter
MKNSKTVSQKPSYDVSSLKNDLIAGFSVSLIALPLCLGIAFASGFPPVAGLLTAIVGGLLASRISGSFVTISGPAAGLIVISLGAAESLGGAGIETGYAGYPYALAAVVLGGVFMTLFGFLKVGKFGDVFPPAVVHGMLAAIGVTIMIKQFFPALGIVSPKGEILHVLLLIPIKSLAFNPIITLIALVSLLILIVHPRIPLKWVKAIPAPMWVLVISISMSWYFKLGQEHSYDFMGSTFALDKSFLVQLPNDILGGDGIRFPDFSKIGMMAFWVAVISFALVSSVESLLSAKAVDAIDPLERKSNLDKDLVAMGSGSAIAGAIGGLPMISEIVRSSANISNGARTQWANFFHGAFLLLFLLLAKPIIEMIPLSALAAMLVFTGFRLASPKEFKHMAAIGFQELTIFVVTLVGVLATDLIIGVIIGMVFKYILILSKGVPFMDLFKLQITVTENDSQTILVPSTTSLVYTNYLKLKAKLDGVSDTSTSVILDLEHVLYIDHTTMSHLYAYEKLLESDGKTFKFSNSKHLTPSSEHKMAQMVRKA